MKADYFFAAWIGISSIVYCILHPDTIMHTFTILCLLFVCILKQQTIEDLRRIIKGKD